MKRPTIDHNTIDRTEVVGSGPSLEGSWIRIRFVLRAQIWIWFVLRGWIRIWSISDLIRNPAVDYESVVGDHEAGRPGGGQRSALQEERGSGQLCPSKSHKSSSMSWMSCVFSFVQLSRNCFDVARTNLAPLIIYFRNISVCERIRQ